MYNATVFIISKRKELAIKYKKLIEALNQNVFIISSYEDAFTLAVQKEPELIIVSDTIDEDLSLFCKKIRMVTFNFRPAVVAVSKSSELNDKLEILDSGADDFLSESMPSKEFQARIRAHLRRILESFINPSTLFVEKNLTIKALKRLIDDKTTRSVMLVEISGINFYKEIYGEIAYQKVLQTMSAIINSALNEDDFAGHFSPKEFIIITHPQKAEKIASFLTFAFDNVLSRFYSDNDYQNNFMILSSDSTEERKIPLMKLSVAANETQKSRFENYKQILTPLYDILKLCKDSKTSCYIIDRPKLYGEVQNKKQPDRVLIMEQDDALAYLLKTSCELNDLNASISSDYEGLCDLVQEFCPDVIIIDYGNEFTKKGLSVCEKIKSSKNAPKVIFSSSVHNKKQILSSGADLYLPKPYEIKTIIKWIKAFLN